MKRSALILIACLSLAGAGCGGSDDDSSSASESTAAADATTSEATTTESSSASKESKSATTGSGKKTKPKVTVPKGVSPNKLAIREIEAGTGAAVKKGDRLTVQYVVAGYDSEEEFESTWETQPYSFTSGAEEVIPGWEQGLEGMKAGGRRELIVPSELAYGTEGLPPTIPPNETLVFVIDLLAVE